MTAIFFAGVFYTIGYDIYGPDGNRVLFSEKEPLKLKELIYVYTSMSYSSRILTIKTNQIIDIGATYNVSDSSSGEEIGSLRRKGIKSIFARDEWIILDSQGQEIGQVQEDKLFFSIIRRIFPGFSLICPQKYNVSLGGKPISFFRQHRNPFVLKYDFDFSPDPGMSLDRRLAVAAGILLCAIEQRQFPSLGMIMGLGFSSRY